MDDQADIAAPPVTELSKGQRRVLGVLLEKAFTTPENYPLTVKALTAGCNQKSNRDPVTNYDEDEVLSILDELRGMGLVAVVHTESGRTERFRHYVRKRFQYTEQQLAIFTELLLRGRQSAGDLRSRASRMVPIDSLDDLREALRGLQSQNAVQASGSLERRGVEIDHNFYQPREGRKLDYQETSEGDERDESDEGDVRSERDGGGAARAASSSGTTARAVGAESAGAMAARLSAAETALERLQSENSELRERVHALQEELSGVVERVERLARDLGG